MKGSMFAGIAVVLVGAVAAQSSRTTWDGVYTEAQATRGATVYSENCAGCHGPALTGADGPPLAGVEFSSNWNGLSLSELFERVRTSMPPDDPTRVSTQAKADVLAHILAVNKFPAGMSDLPRDSQLLAQIRFASNRP